jgi:serine/threonine protein kinase
MSATSPSPAFARGLPERYQLRRHLASGGMASVWCAEDRVLGRQVAIKVLSERYAQNALAVRRFKREARAVARVSAHPNVVTIFDVGDLEPEGHEGHEGDPLPGAFIVMEHLAGGTVADALRCHAVTREEARRWLGQAAAALDHAHSRGIVHRDIKPANFLLDRDRGLHVADFGIAHLQSEETITSSGELFGTAAYLAPEQALGREATSASDRYALAVAAFELLTGGRPYTAQHFAAQARQHIEETPPRASERDPSLPSAVDAVLARGMAKAPEARYPTALAFVEALEAALGTGPTTQTRPLTPVPADRPAPPAVPATAFTRRLTGSVAPAASQQRMRRALPMIALGLAALGVALVLTQLGSGGTAQRAAAVRHRASRTTHHQPAPSKATHSASSSSSATASTSTAAASSTTSVPNAAASPLSASALQLQGHQELLNGNYSAAIPTLQQAVHAASPSSLSYAYALYDLGDALLRSGNPTAAIPVLQQRLRIPNQTATVQALLNQALRAAGQAPNPASPPSTGGASVPPGHQPGHKHGHGPGQGNGGH